MNRRSGRATNRVQPDHHRPVLGISARLWSDGYEERLVVDADTRIPTTYSVERTRT